MGKHILKNFDVKQHELMLLLPIVSETVLAPLPTVASRWKAPALLAVPSLAMVIAGKNFASKTFLEA